MFNGIIIAIGLITAARKGIFRIRTTLSSEVVIGSSVACAGVCLTVIEIVDDMIVVEVSEATFSCTNLSAWKVGTYINLELSLQVGGRIDGHFVLGHVDTLVKITNIELLRDGCYRLTMSAAHEWMKYIVYKGSVALDGVSLTVNEATKDNQFSLNILPYTYYNTTFQHNKVDDQLNLEVDVLARYTARMLCYS